jgi:class 3 adenylate cyclase
VKSTSSTTTAEESFPAGSRHVTILVSELAGFVEWSRRIGDLDASRVAGRLLALQEIILTRDEAGQVLQTGSDSLLAVFDTASAALNRALEIQRVLDTTQEGGGSPARPSVRIGLHTGEVLIREGERVEIINRHVHRARRVMETADGGQILASSAVVEAARDFIEIPPEHLAVQYYGEYYLKGVGAATLCEVADLRFRKPAPPQILEPGKAEGALIGRLELAGYRVLGRLGEGVHGVVYRAEHTATARKVALKVLSVAPGREAIAREQFGRELASLRRQGWRLWWKNVWIISRRFSRPTWLRATRSTLLWPRLRPSVWPRCSRTFALCWGGCTRRGWFMVI